ncbi:TIR domain-containing adapter molecule 1 [Manis javanica]|nr:TIR domain-containing adapter molecule 1 [Manis javanica]
MTVPAQPGWAESIRRLSAAGIQSAFRCYNINSFESVKAHAPRHLQGPLVMNWVAIGGGMDAPSIYSLAHFVRAVPDGAVLTVESNVRSVLPVNMMGIAMGLHVRCGTGLPVEPVAQRRASTVSRIEQLVRIARAKVRPPHRHGATGARHQQDWRVLRHRRRDIGGQRLRAQPQRRQPGISAQDRLTH